MDQPEAVAFADLAGQVSHFLAVGQKRRARELAASLVARSPDDPLSHLVLSRVLVALHELDGAQAAADEVVRLAPDDDRGHRQRAQVLFVRGRFAEAEKAILEALSLEPAEPDTHLLRARLLATCEKRASALEAVEEALVLDPDDADGHQLRALLLTRLRPRDWAISEETAERAVALDPDDAQGHAVLGLVYLKSGREARAEERFRAALALDPGNRLARHGLAEALMARSALYRPFLRYALFVERASPGLQLAFVAGLWALVSSTVPLLRGGPSPLPALADPLRYLYFAFCFYTWFAEPVTRYLLSRHYPWMRDSV